MTMTAQAELMIYDPATGDHRPYPSQADQYRNFHGNLAWLCNPWTGEDRTPADIGSDVFGVLIVPERKP